VSGINTTLAAKALLGGDLATLILLVNLFFFMHGKQFRLQKLMMMIVECKGRQPYRRKSRLTTAWKGHIFHLLCLNVNVLMKSVHRVVARTN